MTKKLIDQKQIDAIIQESPVILKSKKIEDTIDEKNFDEIYKKYLQFSKVIRDSVHGDIWLTELEIAIIDTPIFQRLRRIKQLGPTDLVYPSAKHTRFDHCVGTLFIAQQIIDAINKNKDNNLSFYAIPPRDVITIRILALIHDLAHFPFGHTIEDEGKLFDKTQWEDDERSKYILALIRPIIESHLKDLPNSERENIIKDIESGLKLGEGEKEEAIHQLKRPYIVDIVENTICADLLDYLKRDPYNTGLKMVYDPRIISHFVLVDLTIKIKDKDIPGKRAAILLEKKQGRIKRDILFYCIDLLRMRYSLAEKAYFHRVKCIASAMVIKMIYCALEDIVYFSTEKRTDNEKFNLIELGDENLIFSIMKYRGKNNEKENVKAAIKLANAINNRTLYKDIYSKNYTDEPTYDSLKKFVDKKIRYDKEKELEEICKLDPGSIVIYCPEKQSGKVAETKTLRLNKFNKPIVKTIKELANEENFRFIGQELDILDLMHNRLWNFYILVDKECIKDDPLKEEYLKNFFKELFDTEKLGHWTVILRDYLKYGSESQLTTNQAYTIASKIAAAYDPRDVKKGLSLIDNEIDSLRQKLRQNK